MPCLTALLLLFAAVDATPQINPVPRAVLPETELVRWDFDKTDDGWIAENQCTISAAQGVLKIHSTGDDPYLHHRIHLAGGDLTLRMRARSHTDGGGEIFWTTDRSPDRSVDKSRSFALTHDGQWHEYFVDFSAPGRLEDLRFDPGMAPGDFEIDWIRLVRRKLHPLEITAVQAQPCGAIFTLTNHGPRRMVVVANGKDDVVPAQGETDVMCPWPFLKVVESITLKVQPKGSDRSLPPVERRVFTYHNVVEVPWIVRSLGDMTLEVAPDGSAARVRREGETVAVLAPLVHCNGKIPMMRLLPPQTQSGGRDSQGSAAQFLRFEGEGVTLELSASGKEIALAITSEKACEGPVVRALGALHGGILAGLEYLGKGDASSSRLDIENSEHLRFAPDPIKVTLPLMSFVTDRGAVAMTWSDMSLQPLYATPNFFDGSEDHRMSLKAGPRVGVPALAGHGTTGEKEKPPEDGTPTKVAIQATLLVDRIPVEETILWAVKKHGLPPLPAPPRSSAEQRAICVRALNGPLKTAAGWGHCAEPNWARAWHADVASTVWRLTGQVPELPLLVPGGAHVRNDCVYFLTGRAAEWKAREEQEARALIAQQKPDGSYRYDGPYRRGHFEDTANGVCARPAALLLEYARATGDRESLAAATKTLDYMKRFDVPRGAQVWEIPLHTPDQLASAYAVWAYVRGYELTGKQEYLCEARRWALSGIPFVYLWTRYPIMLYATPPVFGATNWQAPVWIGLPVQWVGGVYAHALTMLAPHDKSLDWNHLARGILISAEQQQYPDGLWAGLLPDSFDIVGQQRRPARINPCALVSLRLAVEGELDSLAVASGDGHRAVAPFPATIRDGNLHVKARAGIKYQVLIDGRRVVEVPSKGEDVVPIADAKTGQP